MMDSTQSKKQTVLITTAVLAAVVFMMFLDIYRCPLEFLFGIPCPLCGATRAILCVFTGRFADAFYYHPLWPVFIVAAVLFILYFFGLIKPGRKLRQAGLIALILLLLVCFVVRHIMHSPVVAIHLDESFLYRLPSLL
ncbi:MAG: DUF2752 domain-containing protein [Lachnospiraceae bacterium]|nr:DUF2752 domain-containing protein [Lachnospiraceae bacterium]